MKSTQIYLTEAEHAALQRAAERAGSSMTAVVRDLIDRYILESEAPPTDLRDLAGIVASEGPTDIAKDRHRLLEESLRADLRRHQRPVRSSGSERQGE